MTEELLSADMSDEAGIKAQRERVEVLKGKLAGSTQSTDILRELVRLFVPRDVAPELYASTFDAWEALDPRPSTDPNAPPRSATGLIAQSQRLERSIDEVVGRSIKERTSTIVEGIHVVPAYHRRLPKDEAVVVPLLLTIPSREQLRRHFLHRGSFAPSRGARRYLERIDIVWEVQEYLIDEAARHGVPAIPNHQVEDTIRRIIQIITDSLVERFSPGAAE